MTIRERISIDEFDGKRFQIRLVEPNEEKSYSNSLPIFTTL